MLIGPSLKSTNPMHVGISTQTRFFSPLAAIWIAFLAYWQDGVAPPFVPSSTAFNGGGNANLPSTFTVYTDTGLDGFVPTTLSASKIVQTSSGLAQANASALSTEYVAANLLGYSTVPSQRNLSARMQFRGTEFNNAIQIYDRSNFSTGVGILLSATLTSSAGNWFINTKLIGTSTGTGAPGTGVSILANNSTSPFIVAPTSTLNSTSTVQYDVQLIVNGNTYSAFVNSTFQTSTTIAALTSQIGVGFGFGYSTGALVLP